MALTPLELIQQFSTMGTGEPAPTLDPAASNLEAGGSAVSPQDLLRMHAATLAQQFGPEHERAILAFIGDIPESSLTPAEATRLADIRAGKYEPKDEWYESPLAGLALFGGLGLAGTLGLGAAGAGAETGLAAELAYGAPELAGSLGLAETTGLAGAAATAPAITAPASAGASAAVPAIAGGSELLAAETAAPTLADVASGAGGVASATLPYERLLAAGLPALLGYVGADQQADALKALADRQFAVGAPSRERYEASFAPDFDVRSLPGLQDTMDVATDTLLRRLSAKSGNPFGDPGGLTEALNYVTGNVGLPALNEYRRLNAGTGGLAALTSGAPQTQTAAIGADANRFNAIGAGAADYFYPRRQVTIDINKVLGLS